MNRKDSGSYDSCTSPTSTCRPLLLNRPDPTPISRREHKQTSDPSSIAKSSNKHPQRPALGKRSSTQPRSAEPRQKSITSSSEASTKSRGQSKPSSRRTSCTLVDPSRPARHYRIKSSQTVPTTNRDIDDVLALHFRSCSLFQDPSYHSSHSHPIKFGYGEGLTEFGSDAGQALAPLSTNAYFGATTTDSPKCSRETVDAIERADTTMHWTSPGTRRREYANIDRANSGLRGFVRKIVPRCVSGPPPPKFYEKDQSDTGSVRRYRMSLDDEAEVKDTSLLRQHDRKQDTPTTTSTGTKRWSCF